MIHRGLVPEPPFPSPGHTGSGCTARATLENNPTRFAEKREPLPARGSGDRLFFFLHSDGISDGHRASPVEMDDYLLHSPRFILCVGREGRAPLALPMWFGWVEGKILMDTALGSRKISAIRRNPLVSCLVESGEDYFALQAVLIVGQCEIIDDQEERRRLADLIFETKPVYRELYPKQLPTHLERFYSQPRAILRVTPHGVTTWNFAKIRR